jgi:hypothetical protein
MRGVIFLLAGMIGLALYAGAGCNAASDEKSVDASNGGSTHLVTVDGISLEWQLHGDSLDVTVAAPTTGWVAVGFDPSYMMKDANFIIGYVREGKVHIRDDYGSEPTYHVADTTSAGGQDNVANKKGIEAEGRTSISFTIPLDSGDSKDRVLVPGQTYTVLLAHGGNDADDFGPNHAKRVSTTIKL